MVQIITNNNWWGGGVWVYKYKWSVDYYADLPTSWMKVWDTYNVVNAFTKDEKDYPAWTNVAWTGTDWDALWWSIDLSDYQKKLVEWTGIDIDWDTNEISVDASIVSWAAAWATALQPNDNVSELNNDAWYITWISGSDVTNALWYTPYNSTNPSWYIDKDVNDLTNYTKTEDLPDFTTYQLKSNMVTSLNSADNDHYPTAKAVKDAITSSWGWDVSWPSSSVDGHLAVFDWTTGKIIKDWWAIPTPTTVVDNLNSTSGTSALSANQGNVLKWYVDTINGKIPSEASSSNKLADKNYVDDSINQVAAYYITRTAAWDAFATKAQLLATTTFYSGWVVRTPTRNDYCIVLADETHNWETTRYSYQWSSWEYQYTVNETALTQQQVDALNSWITSAKVSTYDTAVSTIAWYWDIVTHDASEFATSAQGSKADSALQSWANITLLNNNAWYITWVNWGDIEWTLSNQVDLQNALNAKQASLSTAQLKAVNSWITSSKVSTYDWYATTIWNKANTADVLTKTNTEAYTPTANYHPSTKKYVDDWLSGKQATISDLSTIRSNATNWATVVSGDSWTTYTIKKSTTAPTSASNTTITFVVE